MNEPTEICITIDTEFSIAGHFDDPQQYKPVAEPVVTCPVNGKGHGLAFMLETFARFDTKASFFVETANHRYFGDHPMSDLVNVIKQANQDIQLHVHPVWLSFGKDDGWGSFPRNDNCAKRSFEGLLSAFRYCTEVFERWVGTRPLAVRTGSLWCDRNVYKVLAELNIPMASNVAMGVFRPEETALQHYSGRHLIEGVMELPVFTYQDANILGRRHMKSLQITSCSWPEMKHLLWKARREGISNIVVLTHPFEYIKKADFQYRKTTVNRVNQARLRKLCAFIDEHDQDFVSTDFTRSANRWLSSELEQPLISIPTYYSLGRKVHNKINDSIWRY